MYSYPCLVELLLFINLQASKELFTGPFAREMLDPRNGGESQNENEKWKMFALLEKNKQGLVLKKDSEVLYQVYRKAV